MAKSEIKILLGTLILIFLGIYLTFLFADLKKSEWLGVYFVDAKDETLHFMIENYYNEEKNCEVKALSANSVFFEKTVSLKSMEVKKVFIEPQKYQLGVKNSIQVTCGDIEREIYKYIK